MFEAEGVPERLEAFASEFGPRFYGLPLNAAPITLERHDHLVPQRLGKEIRRRRWCRSMRESCWVVGGSLRSPSRG